MYAATQLDCHTESRVYKIYVDGSRGLKIIDKPDNDKLNKSPVHSSVAHV